MVKTVLLHFKKIDILFNNAADFQSMAGIYEVEPELWWHDVTVNLYGSLLVIREILPHMISRNEGIIINMDGGRPAGGSGYSCGKAGLMELTRIMVEELKMIKSSVMVFRAGPGLVRTEMTELQTNTVAGRKWFKTKDSFDQGKVRKPEEIARATIKMVKAARPESSGKSYGPDTDFSDF
jgi:3-oxoacyl-[acyl-carrier protein] reductase